MFRKVLSLVVLESPVGNTRLYDFLNKIWLSKSYMKTMEEWELLTEVWGMIKDKEEKVEMMMSIISTILNEEDIVLLEERKIAIDHLINTWIEDRSEESTARSIYMAAYEVEVTDDTMRNLLVLLMTKRELSIEMMRELSTWGKDVKSVNMQEICMEVLKLKQWKYIMRRVLDVGSMDKVEKGDMDIEISSSYPHRIDIETIKVIMKRHERLGVDQEEEIDHNKSWDDESLKAFNLWQVCLRKNPKVSELWKLEEHMNDITGSLTGSKEDELRKIEILLKKMDDTEVSTYIGSKEDWEKLCKCVYEKGHILRTIDSISDTQNEGIKRERDETMKDDSQKMNKVKRKKRTYATKEENEALLRGIDRWENENGNNVYSWLKIKAWEESLRHLDTNTVKIWGTSILKKKKQVQTSATLDV